VVSRLSPRPPRIGLTAMVPTPSYFGRATLQLQMHGRLFEQPGRGWQGLLGIVPSGPFQQRPALLEALGFLTPPGSLSSEETEQRTGSEAEDEH
jgi:hypothetical protein